MAGPVTPGGVNGSSPFYELLCFSVQNKCVVNLLEGDVISVMSYLCTWNELDVVRYCLQRLCEMTGVEKCTTEYPGKGVLCLKKVKVECS